MKRIEKALKHYPELILLYQALDKHLNYYADILQPRNSFAVVSGGIRSFMRKNDMTEKRAEEFSEIKYHFEQSIQSIISCGNTRPDSNQFEAARACFNKIKKVSENAQKGFFQKSRLHEEVAYLAEKIVDELSVIQNKRTNKYKDKIYALQAEMKTDYTEMEDVLRTSSVVLPQNQATASDASDNETAAATGYSFFPAGR